MDLRVQKTKNSILDAFIELRSEKPLEKITVKELADRARISKQTFYLHYKDIYDLSEQLLEHSKEATLELFHAAATQSTLFRTVFSGSRASALTEGLEREIKKIIIANNPEVEHDLKANICLTILIHGCYLAYQKYSAGAPEEVAQILSEISGEITARCQSEM